ncbi:hypothetical protein [Fortiea sp. LEGE XX443]|nr:hypothetical protein [Fortiea sp. LEGE XX443]
MKILTPEGQLIVTLKEFVQEEVQHTDRLAAKLRELNIEPDAV